MFLIKLTTYRQSAICYLQAFVVVRLWISSYKKQKQQADKEDPKMADGTFLKRRKVNQELNWYTEDIYHTYSCVCTITRLYKISVL